MKKRKKVDYEQPELVDFLDLLGKNVAYGAMVHDGGELVPGSHDYDLKRTHEEVEGIQGGLMY